MGHENIYSQSVLGSEYCTVLAAHTTALNTLCLILIWENDFNAKYDYSAIRYTVILINYITADETSGIVQDLQTVRENLS